MGGWETQLRKGLSELAVLAAIGQGETYGYRIVDQLRRLDGLELTESTVYPVLTRLARDGFLAVRTAESPAGPTSAITGSRGSVNSAPPDGGELDDGFQVPFRINRRRRDMTVAAGPSLRISSSFDRQPARHNRSNAAGPSFPARPAGHRQGGGVADLRAASGARA